MFHVKHSKTTPKNNSYSVGIFTGLFEKNKAGATFGGGRRARAA